MLANRWRTALLQATFLLTFVFLDNCIAQDSSSVVTDEMIIQGTVNKFVSLDWVFRLPKDFSESTAPSILERQGYVKYKELSRKNYLLVRPLTKKTPYHAFLDFSFDKRGRFVSFSKAEEVEEPRIKASFNKTLDTLKKLYGYPIEYSLKTSPRYNESIILEALAEKSGEWLAWFKLESNRYLRLHLIAAFDDRKLRTIYILSVKYCSENQYKYLQSIRPEY